MVRDDVTMK